ncbi:MAG: beta-ketoacyl-ACP synthase II [Acholeplasma sp.]|nr:beta-ketoacyl-ACP synthase II [Acholeplasma sp.]
MSRRVVITGMGTVNPLGHNTYESFNNMLDGENGISEITLFDPHRLKVKMAGEVKNLNLEDYFDHKEIKRNDRVMLLGLIAAKEAFEQANLNQGDFDPYRFGTFVTSGIGGLSTFYEEMKTAILNDPNRVSPFFVPKTIINMTSGAISIKYGLKGPNLPIVTACSASTNSIGEAYRNIKHGYIDFAISGGSEASVTEIGISAFQALRALSTSTDKDRASIPFDLERNGFVMAEGAGVIILEEYEMAKKRGAKILGELVGYGATSDAFHVTAPDENAAAITKAITLALEEAGLSREEIDYINAHGTSTQLNDKIETIGIKNAFLDHAKKISISSTKSMTGHALGAAGAIESIVCLKVLESDTIPPTINYRVKDENCDLDYTVNQKKHRKVKYAMNINLGFGGHNAVLIFKKGDELND